MFRKILFTTILAASSMSHAQDPYPYQSISELRQFIDTCDDDILEQLNKRMYYAKQIGLIKKMEGTAVADPVREKQIIDRLIQQKHEHLSDAQIRDIWITFMLVSRQLQ